jgi:predicted nucleotidyltransferase
MYIEKRHEDIVQEILKPYPYEFYAFGSRVKGTNRKFSDLDLCYMVDIPFRDLRKITQAFEDSTLPFKVDIVNYSRCNKSFQEHLKNEIILFKKKSN